MIKFSRTSTRQLPGRRPAHLDLSPAQIKAEAARLLVTGISNETWRVLDWLFVGGVMSIAQLQLSPRTLRKYARLRLIDRLPIPTKEIVTTFEQHKIPFDDAVNTQLYILGPVGFEVVKERHKSSPLTGFLSFPLSRIMHDVILNEIVLRLIYYAEEQGWEAIWMGTNSAMIFDAEKNQEVLEPDALLIFQNGSRHRAFCVEFHHHEDKQTRAEWKVKKYQAGYEHGQWRTNWDLETFPTVLAVFEAKIVGMGYQTALHERKTDVIFCGKSLAGVLRNNLVEWTNFATGQKILLLE